MTYDFKNFCLIVSYLMEETSIAVTSQSTSLVDKARVHRSAPQRKRFLFIGQNFGPIDKMHD